VTSATAHIAELQRDQIQAACTEEFRLSDAVPFALSDQPPKTALNALQAMRERTKEAR
jgi:hypothetical protein